jgi:hypothetical protein
MLSGQEERRQQIYALYRHYMRGAIDENGGWHSRGAEPSFREKLWHCLPLLDAGGGDAELANRILRVLQPVKCHFSPMTSMQMLLKYEKRLQEDVKAKLEQYVRESLTWMAEDRIHFTMYNDNFAAMAMFTLMTAGERFGDDEAFAAGRRKLDGLAEVLKRSGTIMEYGSPTYTPITAHALAETAEYVADPDTKRTALQCEERMWAEMALRFHPPTSTMAGPYSRAYLVDSVGHVHLIHALLYLAFGDAVFVNPVRNLFPPDDRQVIHIGADTLMWPNVAWLVGTTCHCPAHLAELLLNKQYPFEAIATSEGLPGSEYLYHDTETGSWIEYGAHRGPNVTYMTEDYALGTAYSQFFDGAISDTFHLVYRRKEDACSPADIRTVFSRYLVNERMPGETNVYAGSRSHGPEMLRDEGRKHAIQHKDCALVVYKPKPFEADNVTSMKLSILFPLHYGGVEQIWLGDRRADEQAGESAEPVTVFVKDGPVYMAFRPLKLTDLGRSCAVRTAIRGKFLEISFYNYEGESRSFDPKELLLVSSGFAVHMKQAKQYRGFREFMEEVGRAELSDRTTGQLNGYTRWIRYVTGQDKLEFAYSPRSEGILYATVNGVPRPEPLIQAPHLDIFRLSFTNA